MRFDVLEVEGSRIERVSVTFESRRAPAREPGEVETDDG
jgi:hypothetical protein